MNPATGEARSRKIDSSLEPSNGPAVAGRFLKWFILGGQEGYKVGLALQLQVGHQQLQEALYSKYDLGYK